MIDRTKLGVANGIVPGETDLTGRGHCRQRSVAPKCVMAAVEQQAGKVANAILFRGQAPVVGEGVQGALRYDPQFPLVSEPGVMTKQRLPQYVADKRGERFAVGLRHGGASSRHRYTAGSLTSAALFPHLCLG